MEPSVESKQQEAPTEQITITPNEAGPSTSRGIIETPDWIKVTSGQDDEEEARDELLVTRNPVSPVRRLRRLSASNEVSTTTMARLTRREVKMYQTNIIIAYINDMKLLRNVNVKMNATNSHMNDTG